MSNLDLLEEKIKSAESILLVTHVNPDGDALGSLLAMKNILKQKYNKLSDAVIIGKVPEMYSFLPCNDELISADEISQDKIYDVAIALDVACLDRLLFLEKNYNISKYKVNFDHHKTNVLYGDLAIVDASASSTGEVLFSFFESIKASIDIDTAICLYCSILTDTGSFKYKNTTAKSMMIASKLLEIGVKQDEISQKIYGNKPKSMVMLCSSSVNNAKFLKNDKIAYTVVTLKDLEKFNATIDYTEGIVEILREIGVVEIAILFKELKNGYTKISMRSKNADISKICQKYDGGGHTNAAGCTIKKSVNIAIDKILAEIENIKL